MYRTVIDAEADREDEGERWGGLARKTVRDIEELTTANQELAGERRRLLRCSRGKLGKEGAALLQGMEDELKVLERYF